MKFENKNLMPIKNTLRRLINQAKKLYFSSQFIEQRGNGRKTWQTIDNALHKKSNRPISQTVFMLSIAINRANRVCATVIIKHNYMLMCNHKIVKNIMLCLLNSTGHI